MYKSNSVVAYPKFFCLKLNVESKIICLFNTTLHKQEKKLYHRSGKIKWKHLDIKGKHNRIKA